MRESRINLLCRAFSPGALYLQEGGRQNLGQQAKVLASEPDSQWSIMEIYLEEGEVGLMRALL